VSNDGWKKRTADGKQGNGNWKKKFKKALRTEKGLKTIMSILASEEKSNKEFVAALTSALPHLSESKSKGNKVTLGLPALRNHFQVFDTTKLLNHNNNITYLLQTPILRKIMRRHVS